MLYCLIGARADPGESQPADDSQNTVVSCHYSARPAVTFPAAEYHRHLASTKLGTSW